MNEQLRFNFGKATSCRWNLFHTIYKAWIVRFHVSKYAQQYSRFRSEDTETLLKSFPQIASVITIGYNCVNIHDVVYNDCIENMFISGSISKFPRQCCALPFTLNGGLFYGCTQDPSGAADVGCFLSPRVWVTCGEPSNGEWGRCSIFIKYTVHQKQQWYFSTCQ